MFDPRFSPLFNTGNPAVPGSGGNACVGRDQRDYPRTLPRGLASSKCDLGAFQSGYCPPEMRANCREPVQSQKSLFRLVNKTDDNKDVLVWKWLKGQMTSKADFGEGADAYTLCAYDDSGLIVEAFAPGGSECGIGNCWTDRPTVLKYLNPGLFPEGLKKVLLKPGLLDGQAKIIVKGVGTSLRFLPPPWLGTVTAQTVNETSQLCWSARFSAPLKNTSGLYKAKGD